ncbi:MAG: DUF421 domain-containing protein [Clostridia bacterium]|nr:DUF421 domain-containing protein [Clostridia bacterium]
MGKRQIGELQPFELVITLMLAELAVLPMQETGMSLINGIVPLITLVSLHFFISFLARKSLLARKVIDGNPIIIINPDGIQFEKLKKLNININDLQEGLRNSGYFNFDDIEYALIETNGKLSVLPKSDKRPIIPRDLKIKPEVVGVDVCLIIDGKILEKNLKQLNINQSFLIKYLQKAKINSLKELLTVTISNSGTLYIQPKRGKSIVYETHHKGGILK